jgi:hypothetical protein
MRFIRIGIVCSHDGRLVSAVQGAGSFDAGVAPWLLLNDRQVRSTVLVTEPGLDHERDGNAAVGHVAQP